MKNKAKELTMAAKQANGRSRMCATCPLHKPNKICSPEALKVCSDAFVEGFKKGAKWFEEQLNSITKVEPKQKRKGDETDENFFRFFKSKCEHNKGDCCIKHGSEIACCIQNCHSFKEWL